MLTQFRFENFKSWRDTGNIRMAPLTGIFGTNSSGKTAILQFLLMLKQTVESSDRNLILNLGNERTYTNLGTSYDIIHQHQLPGNIKFSLSWKIDEVYSEIAQKLSSFILENYTSQLRFTSNISFDIDQIDVEEFFYQIEELFYLSEKSEGEFQQFGIKIDRTNPRNSKYWLFNKEDLFEFNYAPIKSYGFPIECSILDEIYADLVLIFENLFERIYYLGPLREYPQRSYLWSGERSQDVGKKGEFIASALLASRKQGLNVEERVACWLKQLGLIHDFQVKPIAENRQYYEIRVRRFANSSEVLITDVGFGVSQILPVLVLCYYVPEGSTIIFEQPEIHLHPSVQAGLADVFIDVIKTRNVQIILESHSEHLLRRLQRRIAEEHNHMTAEDAALYFCSIDDTGTSKLTELELDTYGSINNWPQGFFGDEMGDLVAMTEAAMRRQMPKS
jgi:hypothetical protein